MTNKVTSVVLQSELVVDFLHCAGVDVQTYIALAPALQRSSSLEPTLVSGGVLLLEFANPFQELLSSPLLEQPHER